MAGKRVTSFDLIVYSIVTMISVLCILPFIYVISVSLTDSSVYVPFKFYFFPEKLSFRTYSYILGKPDFIYALRSTLFITIVGTVLNIIVTFTFAYGLTKKDLPMRKFFMALVMFALLFNSGIIPNYWLVKSMGLINSYWSIILPLLTDAWSIVIARSFLQNLPSEIEESAMIDGCSYIQAFSRIVVPLSMAAIASLTLFFAVGHWNVYFKPLMYLTDYKKRTLQVYVKMLLVDSITQEGNQAIGGQDDMAPPSETLRMATVVLAMIPILCVYPFVQKYFMKGVMLGSVKG